MEPTIRPSAQPTRPSAQPPGLEKIKFNDDCKMSERSRSVSGPDTLEGALGWDQECSRLASQCRGYHGGSEMGGFLSVAAS